MGTFDLSRLQNMLSTLKERDKQHINDKILLVDGLNLFLRGYTSNPIMNSNGQHVGGVIGALLSLQHAIKQFSPTRCIVVFDGKEGYTKRRALYEDYKMNRKEKPKPKYNRRIEEIEGLDENQEELNKIWQISRFIQYLEQLPITLLQIDYIEADDVISYINNRFKEKFNSEVIIMSSDKDFLQLVDDKTYIWSPTKKKYYDVKSVIEEYNILPSKFVYYRAINGDPSDNIPGIPNVGDKTIGTWFGDLLTSSEDINFEKLLNRVKELQNIKNNKIKKR